MSDHVNPGWTLAVHGGSGSHLGLKQDPQRMAEMHAALRRALLKGSEILARDGTAVDAVEAAVQVLEDDPTFNAGKGAAFTSDGKNELDAAIMDGRTRAAGAVAGVTRTKNPIRLARAVMERSPYLLLHGDGAEAFASEHQIEQVDPAYFFTTHHWEQLQQFLQRGERYDSDLKYETVGAVARDAAGDVAAATSTGGLMGKRWGRIGDSPLIGAGTYAEPGCAVSCTGAGEYFIRAAVAHEICARIRLTSKPLQQVIDEVVHGHVSALGGKGGVIAVAADGAGLWSFNTPAMCRGRISQNVPPQTAIFGDDEVVSKAQK